MVAPDLQAVNSLHISSVSLSGTACNCGFVLLHNVGIVSGQRSCLLYDFGAGRAANVIFTGGECAQGQDVTNPAIRPGSNLGSAIVKVTDWVMG
jgi:hypothetical protein